MEALGAARPVYAHVPMINGSDGKKLSKRHGAVSVLEYRDQGFLPEALTNYLARLGWSHGDQEIFSRAELIEAFDFDGLNKSAATFDWDKLSWLNQHYIQHAAPADLVAFAEPYLASAELDLDNGPEAEQSRMFYGDLIRDEAAAKKHLRPVIGPALTAIKEKFTQLEVWDGAVLKDIVEQTAAEFDMKMGKVAQPLRVAVTGSSASPSIDITLELVGQARCLERLAAALIYIDKRAAA
jgi:glutamyl-tRNA synthetase